MVPSEVAVHGIGANMQSRTHGQVTLTLRSTRSSFTMTLRAIVIGTITSALPDSPVDVTRWRHIGGLDLADKHFGTPGVIDVLLGADSWGLVVQDEVVHGLPHEPHAQRTRFGWVVFGPTTQLERAAAVQTLHCRTIDDTTVETRLEELVQKFWTLEEVALDDTREDECSRHFDTTHYRTPEGRYVVKLPMRYDAPALGDSYRAALSQFYRLERRLASNYELRTKYVDFMREYEALGHMERAQDHGDRPNRYYIPHHAVTEKFRVVFNASARTTNGVSLNDVQLVGPTIQQSLVNVILGFRRFRVALTADVEKMFRQVLVAPEDRDLQRILWRESPADELTVYRLTTVTYGMASSPYTSVRSMVQCARDNHHLVDDPERASRARHTIENSFYVDDLLTSCSGSSEAVTLASDVQRVLMAGHFKLRKWNSNCAEVIGQINNDFSPSSLSTELVIECPTATVLGLRWDPTGDELFFKVELEKKTTGATKRKVLSEVAQLFDPTGLLAPVVIVGKLLIQTLWAAGLAWDAPLPPQLELQWTSFRDDLQNLNRVRVPRWLGMHEQRITTIHGFCDASAKAYAAVIYLHTIDECGLIHVALLTARTKVAPLKGATIPRLELCAASLLAVTLGNVRQGLALETAPCFLWSDSQIVLCWLRKEPSVLRPYVANRVRQIQELTSPDQWYYVRSAENPADCASRGLAATSLIQHVLWWQGPSWLRTGVLPIHPPGQLGPTELEHINREARNVVFAGVTTSASILTTRRRDAVAIPLIERFSKLPKLLRTVAYMTRWLKPYRHLMGNAVVAADELNLALERLIKMEQMQYFHHEIRQIRRKATLAASSPLLSLNPFLDARGILRVGGRLTHSALPTEQRFPTILPKTGRLTWLLIEEVHTRTIHGGVQLMLQTLRQNYWILHGRQVVRTYLHKCVTCRRHRGTMIKQQMAPLPSPRVNPSRPFETSGVDYCGPFILRVGAKRSRATTKGYLAIFVCMATKAVHLEVIEDLASQTFLDAFTRFTSRRGPCRHLYSDNGTAFVGANRLLKEDLAQFQSSYNQQALANGGTSWHFITPGAPHQGGLWEAAVKSAKHHLKRLIGSQAMWYNQLQTLATRIEACLNSRPIIPLHDDPDDKLALTPGDFLIGSPVLAVPEPQIGEVPLNRLKQYQWIRKIHQEFWKRWSDEYLVTLQTRGKWEHREAEVQVNDIVLVRHDNLPPTHWRLGRVVAIHPGRDGIARNVTLKTPFGECRRPVQKLCRLLEASTS